MKLEYSRHIFEKYQNIKFHENPSTGSRVVPCGRKDTHTHNTPHTHTHTHTPHHTHTTPHTHHTTHTHHFYCVDEIFMCKDDLQYCFCKMFAVFCNVNLYICSFWLFPLPTVFMVHLRVHGMYRGADKSLARPGRKQATATEDFDFHISYL